MPEPAHCSGCQYELPANAPPGLPIILGVSPKAANLIRYQ
jgi:hypothetical protein